MTCYVCANPTCLDECIPKTTTSLKLSTIDNIISTIDYTSATIAPGNQIKIPDEPEWIGVHKGRAYSSYNQLQAIRKQLVELKKEMGDG